MSTPLTRHIRGHLLRFSQWLEAKMKAHPDYSRNDPEWVELQNRATALKRDLRKGKKE